MKYNTKKLIEHTVTLSEEEMSMVQAGLTLLHLGATASQQGMTVRFPEYQTRAGAMLTSLQISEASEG